jgi:hypothetical protein
LHCFSTGLFTNEQYLTQQLHYQPKKKIAMLETDSHFVDCLQQHNEQMIEN